jgi:transglutaminase-like putative cysteine protease
VIARAARTCAIAVAALAAAGALLVPAQAAAGDGPVLHEPIAPDPAEDLALRVAVEGNLPAAIRTQSGAVGAPDPLRPPSPSETSYGMTSAHDAFAPDTDTRRPEVSAYDDPFTPSTVPFKRLEAFDMVRSDYALDVRDPSRVKLDSVHNGPDPSPAEDAFYGDLVVDLPPEGSVRIPSVGPGSRVMRARLGVGATEVPFRILRDGADNWFLQPTARPGGPSAIPTRARLVFELAIPRAAFGGDIGDPSWAELSFVAPLPENVARDATRVRAAIGVSRSMRPREALAALVDYFRGFVPSDEPPRSRGSVYLDLALGKKGVCRHRAYAFLVTAQSLGLPTRLVENEAHAWVEVHDGTLWRRIDLGGAGHPTSPVASRLAQQSKARYAPPRDVFRWPDGAHRGDDVVPQPAPGASGTAAAGGGAGTGRGPGLPTRATATAGQGDARPTSVVTMNVIDTVVHRGLPLHVRGDVHAEGAPCPHVSVDIVLREATGPRGDERAVLLGTLATGDDGSFQGIVVPTGMALGDYDLVAETRGDARCGRGRN